MTRLGWFGVILTFLYLAAICILQWEKLSDLGSLELNNFGDFLAGAFGPLAIFWLVLGFFQQGAELRNSVETMKLQAEELRASVDQQRELVAVTREALAAETEALAFERNAHAVRMKPKVLHSTEALGNTGATNLILTNSGGSEAFDVYGSVKQGDVTLATIDQSTLAPRTPIKVFINSRPPMSANFAPIIIEYSYSDSEGGRYNVRKAL